MLISLLMPTYNGVRFLKAAIDSVKAQTYSNWELVITDDCSNDGTWELATALAIHEPRIKLQQNEKRLGTVKNRKRCYEYSTGNLIGHFDQDDMLERWALDEMIRSFQMEPEIMLFYSDVAQIGEAHEHQLYSVNKDFNPMELYNHGWRHLGMYRRDVMQHIAGYNDKIVSACEDGDLFMQIAEKNFGIKRIPKILYLYRAHQNNQSKNNKKCNVCEERNDCNFIRVWDKAISLKNVKDKTQQTLEPTPSNVTHITMTTPTTPEVLKS